MQHAFSTVDDQLQSSVGGHGFRVGVSVGNNPMGPDEGHRNHRHIGPRRSEWAELIGARVSVDEVWKACDIGEWAWPPWISIRRGNPSAIACARKEHVMNPLMERSSTIVGLREGAQ